MATGPEASDAPEAPSEPAGERPRRIAVMGTSGAGKTTFAAAVAARLGLRHVELDALFWLPDWQEPGDDEFRAAVVSVLDREDGYVVDGNYSRVQDLVFDRVDTVVWLDIGLVTCLRRVTARAVRRAWAGEVLWGTNHERWRDIVGPRSLGWWVITTHGSRRRTTSERLAGPALQGRTVLRFRSNSAAEAWLASVRGE
jgi:adenylate kinase family enzyme